MRRHEWNCHIRLDRSLTGLSEPEIVRRLSAFECQSCGKRPTRIRVEGAVVKLVVCCALLVGALVASPSPVGHVTYFGPAIDTPAAQPAVADSHLPHQEFPATPNFRPGSAFQTGASAATGAVSLARLHVIWPASTGVTGATGV